MPRRRSCCARAGNSSAENPNIRLQYLLVRSLYTAGKFKEAQQEMAVFFTITDAKGEERTKIYQNYPQDVDQLTNDETREISIMIDKIDREVAAGTEQKNAAAAAVAAKGGPAPRGLRGPARGHPEEIHYQAIDTAGTEWFQ